MYIFFDVLYINLIGIAAKIHNVVSNPFQGQLLVPQALMVDVSDQCANPNHNELEILVIVLILLMSMIT